MGCLLEAPGGTGSHEIASASTGPQSQTRRHPRHAWRNIPKVEEVEGEEGGGREGEGGG